MAHPIPSAKTAVKAILAARPAWAAVDIRDGQPTEKEDVLSNTATPGNWDAFWFEPTEIVNDDFSSVGGLGRRITFRLNFTIGVLRDGDDERTTEDLMDALRTDHTLTGTIQKIEIVTGREANDPLPRGWRAAFTGGVQCLSKSY